MEVQRHSIPSCDVNFHMSFRRVGSTDPPENGVALNLHSFSAEVMISCRGFHLKQQDFSSIILKI